MSASVAERSRIQLCGRLSIELDGRELVGTLRGRQVPLLFAYLALNRDRALSRDELADALWPDDVPRSQDAALRTLLSRLRSALGGETVVGRDEISLQLPEPVWIDLEAASAGVARAAAHLDQGDARAAWALAQVPLNIAGRGLLSGVRATWLEPPRRELAELRLLALEIVGRAGLALGGGQLASVLRAGRALIESEPFRESGYVLLMQALAAQGNVAEGLRVYERLRALLRDEIGTTPSPHAITVHDRLLGAGRSGARAEAPATDSSLGTIELPARLLAGARGELVGRRRELELLHDWWREGRPPVLLLGGEAGIGKSRLLGELAATVHAEGAVVLAGQAPEETLVPYGPFLEAIGHFAFHASAGRLRAAARESAPELAPLVPELRRRLPDLPAPAPADPDTDRYRLFEATAALLGQIARQDPVLIVLDDLGWADRPTLLLLRHLARSPQAQGLRIIGAVRMGEPPAEGFAASATGLRREGLLRQVELGGLPRADAAELVRQRAGGAASAAFLSALWDETEGNPFFIEELVRHLAESGVAPARAASGEVRRVGLPADVRDLVARRLARLSDDGLECLRVAAVIGRVFDGVLLERVLDIDEASFLIVIEHALDAGLIVETPGELSRYAFAHALIRETLYDGMSAARRARTHHRVGRALERLGEARPDRVSGPTLGALALHFTHAPGPEDAEQAIGYALAAGEQASAMLAHEDAAAHYERALEVLERFDPHMRARRVAVLLELGSARLRSGDRPQAWEAFHEAATIAAELGDGDALIRAALGASRRFIQPPGLVEPELLALLERASQATAGERTLRRIRLLTRLCAALHFTGRSAEMRRLSAEATSISAHLGGEPEAAALAAAARRRAWWDPVHIERRLADSTMLLRAARDAEDLELTLQGHAWLVIDLLEMGDRVAVQAQIDAFDTGARSLRQPLYAWNVLVWRAMLALLDGRLADAERLSTEAHAVGSRVEGTAAALYRVTQLMGIRREQLRAAEVLAMIRGDVIAAEHAAQIPSRTGTCLLMSDLGRLDRAAGLLTELIGPGTEEIPEDGDWLAVMSTLAEVAAEVGDLERSALLYERLRPYAEAIIVFAAGAVCWGSTSRQLGRLALTLGETQSARVHLERAVQANRALRAPVAVAHAQIDLARALDDERRAGELLDQAGATAQAFGLALLARRAAAARALMG